MTVLDALKTGSLEALILAQYALRADVARGKPGAAAELARLDVALAQMLAEVRP